MKARVELEHEGTVHVYEAEFASIDVESDYTDIYTWQSLYPVHKLTTGTATTLKFNGRLEEIYSYDAVGE